MDLEEDQVLSVRGDPQHPTSRGYTCGKGRALGKIEHAQERLRRPRLRLRGDEDWAEVVPEALVADLAVRLARVRITNGPDSIGIYQGTGAGFDASLWSIARRFARAIGTEARYTSLTVDAIAKPYVAQLMAGDPRLVPHPDASSTLVLLLGTNPVVSHGHTVAMPDPVSRLRAWTTGGEVWVIDPRCTETAQRATWHVACRPGTDHLLLGHLVREALREASIDDLSARARSIDALREAVQELDLANVAAACDLEPRVLEELVAALRRHRRVAVVTGTGSTFSRAANLTEWLAWCLCVVTDSFDRPGGMWFHPGFFADQEPGRARPATDEAGGAGPPVRFGERPSATLVDDVEQGRVHALLVLGGNPLAGLPDTRRTYAALRRLDLLAVADVVAGPVAALATHVLPCPTQLERADVSLHTDRAQPAVMGQYTPALRAAPDGVRPGWWWLAALGEHLGLAVLPHGLRPASSGDDDVLRSLCNGSRFDEVRTSATGYALAPGADDRTAGLSTPRRRFDLAPAALVAQWQRERRLSRAPAGITLVPRREPDHVNSVFSVAPDAVPIAISPGRAVREGLADGDAVMISTTYGTLRGRVRVDSSLGPDVVSVPHGYSIACVNELTAATDLDPDTGMPRYTALDVALNRSDPIPAAPN